MRGEIAKSICLGCIGIIAGLFFVGYMHVQALGANAPVTNGESFLAFMFAVIGGAGGVWIAEKLP